MYFSPRTSTILKYVGQTSQSKLIAASISTFEIMPILKANLSINSTNFIDPTFFKL
ncbi:unnamed protein product [Brugia timori]|uniref:Uncharacterized protein n=1 Tax=Brugia timori TaxID=42155 RepID=A0A0R3Q9S8_9BILA|nr:unnamed protein product [Brugia timori]